MSRLSLLTVAILVVALAHAASADDNIIDQLKRMDIFKLQNGNQACPIPVVGQTCPESNPLFYFSCCGDLNSSCCFRLQDWLMALLILLAVLVVISIVINFIRCLFCY